MDFPTWNLTPIISPLSPPQFSTKIKLHESLVYSVLKSLGAWVHLLCDDKAMHDMNEYLAPVSSKGYMLTMRRIWKFVYFLFKSYWPYTLTV